jgi:hypothetical protein
VERKESVCWGELLHISEEARLPSFLMDWLGEGFDPEAFDLGAINQELQDITI